MSEWEFLWGLTGQELEDAMACGYTKEDAPYVEGWKYVDEVLEALINGNPLESVISDDPELVLPDLKVFIDGENISAKSYDTIKRVLHNIGEEAEESVYGLQKDPATKGWHAIVLAEENMTERRLCGPPGKNKCDKKIMKDMKRTTEEEWPDRYLVLVTSDADFVSAVQACRKENFVIIGIGEKKTPEQLRKAYTKFIELP